MTLNVLHLPERIDREELFRMEFTKQGVYDFKVWDGIRNHISFVGISAAHKRIVRDAMTRGLKKCLICEDDIKFTCGTSFKYFLDKEPDDYDIYLGGIYMGTINEDNTVDDFSGLTLYMIHERYYQAFLDTPMLNHIDRAQSEQDPDNPGRRRPRGRFIVCDPFVVTQWTTFSDCQNAMIDHSHWLSGRRLYNDKNLPPKI
jgi:hypothetical protein